MTETIGLPIETETTCYDVVLVTNDGEESTISCDSGTTVLTAAECAGLVLKSSCQNGGSLSISPRPKSACSTKAPMSTCVGPR